MNKFERNLNASNSDIKGKRAKDAKEEAQEAMFEEVRELKKIKDALQRKMTNLEDMYSEDTTSLMPSKKGWNAQVWAKEIVKTDRDLAYAIDDLSKAQKLHDEWFNEDVTK